MKIVIEVELGNEAMETYVDVVEAVRKGFDSVVMEQDFPNDTRPDEDATGLIRDRNGNSVGKWEVSR